MKSSFSFRQSGWIVGLAILLLAPVFYWVCSFLVPIYRVQYTTEIELGQLGAGAPLTAAQSVITHTQDVTLEHPSREFVEKYGTSDLRSLMMVRSIDAQRAIQLLSSGSTGSAELHIALHRYVADRIMTAVTRDAALERSRIDAQISYFEEYLRNLELERSKYESFSKQVEQGKVESDKLRAQLGTPQAFAPAQTVDNAAQKVIDSIVLRALMDLSSIEAPLKLGRASIDEAMLGRDVASTRLELSKAKLESARFSEPKVVQLATTLRYVRAEALLIRIVIAALGAALVGVVIAVLIDNRARRRDVTLPH